MGDRAVVVFAMEQGQPQAAVYLHWGGSEADEVLADFFSKEESDSRHDNRFNDPSYLAARFVVFVSNPNGTGVGIVPAETRQTTNWLVRCGSSGRPEVKEI